MNPKKSPHLMRLLADTLESDAFADDVTTHMFPELGKQKVRAIVRSRDPGIFSGTAFCEAVGEHFGTQLTFEAVVSEGSRIDETQPCVVFQGSASVCLSVERTILNFLSHSCGVATLTSQFVEKVRPYGAKILATRKTLPGLRGVQLMAVRAGGGFVHRRSLSDGILIKENHLVFFSEQDWLMKAKLHKSPLHRVEIEIQHIDELDRVLELRPDIVLLDNLRGPVLEQAVARVRDSGCEIEVSGGVTLENVESLAKLGVQYISVGCLTHSARALDLTMDLERIS